MATLKQPNMLEKRCYASVGLEVKIENLHLWFKNCLELRRHKIGFQGGGNISLSLAFLYHFGNGKTHSLVRFEIIQAVATLKQMV